MDTSTVPSKRQRFNRVPAACDLCKTRKVKCNGELPCGYCIKKRCAETCSFSAPKTRAVSIDRVETRQETTDQELIGGPTPQPSRRQARPRSSSQDQPSVNQSAENEQICPPGPTKYRRHEDTDVPLEARLLQDVQGKVLFIGDCAPLSFLQTIRHFLASEIDSDDFSAQMARDFVIEAIQPPSTQHRHGNVVPLPKPSEVDSFLSQYFVVTSGLIDLFDNDRLVGDCKKWLSDRSELFPESVIATYRLTLAIGAQEYDQARAEAWFQSSLDSLSKHMCGSMTVSTVQGFALLAIFMLRAFQPNAAYLYFALASRAGYAIGLHRSEVNASFGPAVECLRERIWKSLRVVDMLISNILGRPPSTSDIDCTVKFDSGLQHTSVDSLRILDASMHIFLIIEQVVVEVYSRKRISLRIAQHVSNQLKTWASQWVGLLLQTVKSSQVAQHKAVGACQVLCTYFYGIMLLSRPFQISDLYSYSGATHGSANSTARDLEKRKFADAAVDAASSLVRVLNTVIETEKMPARMPLIVSWLFTASLSLAMGILGQCGGTLENDCQNSIQCLDWFARTDPHARQYSTTVKALMKTTTERVKTRELNRERQRKQNSLQLFGLSTHDIDECPNGDFTSFSIAELPTSMPANEQQSRLSVITQPEETADNTDHFSLSWIDEYDQDLQDFLQPGRITTDGSVPDVSLFPIYGAIAGSFDQSNDTSP